MLEFSGSPVEGSGSSYNDIISYVETNTLETEQKYLQVSGKIDINNYIQYQLTEIYINNKDWPGNNIKFWNTNDQGSLWRWIIYDTDFGFSPWEDAAYTFNTMEFATDPDNTEWPNPSWSTLLFRRMLTNQNFRNNFINQYADRLNTNFKYEKVDATVDSIKQVFLPEINDHLPKMGFKL
ncbi:MAG: CotH kinase family protein [Bacteroidales bacterium]|nr:CotH kinase family protein [Bacteroidales bacterium]